MVMFVTYGTLLLVLHIRSLNIQVTDCIFMDFSFEFKTKFRAIQMGDILWMGVIRKFIFNFKHSAIGYDWIFAKALRDLFFYV